MRFLWSKSRELLDFIPKQFKTDYWVFIIKRRPWLKKILIGLFLMPILIVGMTYYYIFRYIGDLKDSQGQKIDFEKTGRSNFKRSSYIYTNNGEMTGRFYEEIRDPVRLGDIPKSVRNGFVAAEDKRFYGSPYLHPGVDPIAIVRAAIGNGLRKINIRYFKNSGASGIPQQYARLIYADELPEFRNRERTLSRKIKEARIAIQIVKHYSRDKILQDFLNMIYFGHGVNGVAEATQRYFGKDIRQDKLNFREVAILVSLNKSPSLYCPIIHKPVEPKLEGVKDPVRATKLKEDYNNSLAREIIRLKNARDRYNWVLGRMLDDGYINQKDYNEAFFKEKEPLELGFLTLKPLKNRTYGYGNRMVKELLMGQGYGDEDLTYRGGLRIYTTFDPEIQKIATEEFEKHLTLINTGKKSEDRLNGAFVIIEIKTGKVLALSGGNDFNETQYNRVLASRSPGSGFKPFTYAAAIEYFHKDFFDQICNCPFAMRGGAGKTWAPQNFKEENPVPYGYINFSTGLIRSVNLATLNLARSIGMGPIIKLANSMGVWGNPGMVRDSNGDIWFKKPGYEIKDDGLVPLLPTAIGASDVNLLELANAYTVFFRNGIYVRPTLVTEVKSTYGDEVVYKPKPSSKKRVLSAETSNKMLALMRAVTKTGTAKISMRDIKQQIACKTGTSNGPRDVSMWCGTPEFVVAVRFGVDDYRVIKLPEYMRKVSRQNNTQVTGGWVAGPLVRKIIDRIYSERQKVEFYPAIEKELQKLLENPQ